jgi:Na+/H+-dicarboxylate symporter
MRSQWHDEVIQAIAGIISSYNNGTVHPVIFLSMFEGTMVACLKEKKVECRNGNDTQSTKIK